MVSRLFQMVYILMDQPGTTAKQLAEKLEVSVRTIQRDVDKLSGAGIPVYTNRGRGGGISLMPDYVLNKTLLSKEDKDQILSSLQALGEVGYQDEKAAVGRLKNFFGQEMTDWLEIEFSGWGDTEAEAEQFQTIKEAILSRFQLAFRYVGNRSESSERIVKPLKLCYRGQAWYLYAYCMKKEDYRFFKLHRMSELSVIQEVFDPIPVGKILKDVRMEKAEAVTVKIAVDEKMAFRVMDELPFPKKLDGKYICTMEIQDMEWFFGYIFSFGEYLEILEPAWVREDAVRRMKKILTRYL